MRSAQDFVVTTGFVEILLSILWRREFHCGGENVELVHCAASERMREQPCPSTFSAKSGYRICHSVRKFPEIFRARR